MALALDERQRAMLQEMGVRVWLPGTAFALASPSASASTPMAANAPQRKRPSSGPPPPPRMAQVTHPDARAPADGVMNLDALDWPALRAAAASCRACGMCAGRTATTLQPPAQDAAGAAARAHWMVVGDPPDDDEDASGQPFVGDSGVLLGNMLQALGLVRINPHPAAPSPHPPQAVEPRFAAYVTQVLKCRTPPGTLPTREDLAQCAAYLHREIALVQPKILVSMGRFANQLLLGETPEIAQMPLGKLRGTVYRYHGNAVVVSYHPKTLLRNSADKAKAWADLCLAADTVDAMVG